MQNDLISTINLQPGSADFLTTKDVISLLHLIANVAVQRHDPHAWRKQLLRGINRLLPAAATFSFALKNVAIGMQPKVVSLFDEGCRDGRQRSTLLREFNTLPFHDPFSIAAIDRFDTQKPEILTSLRSDLIADAVWNSDVHVLTHRKPSQMEDCILSLLRGPNHSTYAILTFREAASVNSTGGPSATANPVTGGRFTSRDRLLLDTLHRSLNGLYQSERHLILHSYGGPLSPRLRQTLNQLLTGRTEREIATQMGISVHTLHDYVKDVYSRFGVSSRIQLIKRLPHPIGDSEHNLNRTG